MRQNPESARERIIATAMELFNSSGVHTTGIDRIIEESGVAKKTFYNHFPSKNKLIAEYLRRKEEGWFAMLERHTSTPGLTAEERVLGIFDGLKEWYSERDFYGCPFIRGLSDFEDEKNDPELVDIVRHHFSKTLDFLRTLLREARPNDYAEFVPQIMSLVAGATIVALATRDISIAGVNKKMAKVLLSSKVV